MVAGIPAADSATLSTQSARSAEQWREDPQAADELEARLQRHGFSEASVNAELFCQAHGVIATAAAALAALRLTLRHLRLFSWPKFVITAVTMGLASSLPFSPRSCFLMFSPRWRCSLPQICLCWDIAIFTSPLTESRTRRQMGRNNMASSRLRMNIQW
jgi:hypothetical protein